MNTSVTVHLVRSAAEYAEAKAYLRSLMDSPDADHRADEITAQAQLIEDYERVHFPIDAPDALAAIRFRMEQEGLDRSDLAKVLEVERGRMSELLSGKRQFTVRMLRLLHTKLHIPADVLLAPASDLKLRFTHAPAKIATKFRFSHASAKPAGKLRFSRVPAKPTRRAAAKKK